jgi:uncharacterized protein
MMPDFLAGFLPGQYEIDAYGKGGFRFSDMSHRGSLLALPSGMRAWEVSALSDTAPPDFAFVLAEASMIELLLIGAGRDIASLPQAVRDVLREAGIRVDVMQTGAAARTYNILLGEKRKVAAALIAVA